MKKKFKFKIIFIPIMLFTLLLSFSLISVKPLKASSDNKYFVNFKDLYISLQELGENPNQYIGTNLIQYDRSSSVNPVWFEYESFTFNTIELIVNGDFTFSITFINTFSGIRVPFVENSLIVVNIPYITISDDIVLSNLFSPNPTYQLNTDDFFLILFSREENYYSIRSGVYDIRLDSIFVNYDIDYPRFNNPFTQDVYFYNTYIVYAPSSMSITFNDGSIIEFTYLLIGTYDSQSFVFTKDKMLDFQDLYWFTPGNEQVEYGLPEYEGIDYIYFPPNTTISRLVYSEINNAYTSTYVFDNSFSYGFTTDVDNFSDFFISIIDVPILYLQSIMSFEIFGINLFYTFTALITSLLCLWIVRKFL